MAINFPSSPTLQQTHTDSNGMIWRYNGFAWEPTVGSSTRFFAGAKITLTSTENLTANLTAVTWDSEVFDTGNYFNSFENTKLVAKETGYYRINARLFTGSSGTGSGYTIVVKKNNSSNLAVVTAGSNQGVVYDEVVYLLLDDYVEIQASESSASGSLTADSEIEFILAGTSAGTNIFNNANKFSGAKLKLGSAEALTPTNTAITWDSTEFNINADATGNVYWAAANSANLKVYTTGYYRVVAYIQVGAGGSANSYNVNLVKNTNNYLTTTKLGPNDILSYDETIQLNTGDVLQIEVAETASAGTVTTNSFLQISRSGV